MFIIIVYKIKNKKLQTRLKKTVGNYGERVQNCVFECNLTYDQTVQLLEKIKVIAGYIEPRDSIRVYQLCKKCLKNVTTYGNAVITQDPLYYMV